MIGPARSALALAAAWLALGVAASFAPSLHGVWRRFGALSAAALVLTPCWRGWRPRRGRARVRARGVARGMDTCRIALENTGRSRRRCGCTITIQCARVQASRRVRVRPRERGSSLSAAARARGPSSSAPSSSRASPLRLFVGAQARPRRDASRVSELRAIARYRCSLRSARGPARREDAAAARRGPRVPSAARVPRRRRAAPIDWKATARLHKPISRDYQDERDQRVVFLLDCGRRLLAIDGARAHFDAAMDAVLLAAYVARAPR